MYDNTEILDNGRCIILDGDIDNMPVINDRLNRIANAIKKRMRREERARNWRKLADEKAKREHRFSCLIDTWNANKDSNFDGVGIS